MLKELIKAICIVFYEALCCKLFLDVFMKQKKEQWERISFIILAILFMIIATITYYSQEYILKSEAVIGAIVLFSFVFYTGSWLMKLFLSMVFYGMMSCIDYLGIVLADLLLSPSTLEIEVVQIMIVFLCKIVLFLFILLLSCFWKPREDVQQMKKW